MSLFCALSWLSDFSLLTTGHPLHHHQITITLPIQLFISHFSLILSFLSFSLHSTFFSNHPLSASSLPHSPSLATEPYSQITFFCSPLSNSSLSSLLSLSNHLFFFSRSELCCLDLRTVVEGGERRIKEENRDGGGGVWRET